MSKTCIASWMCFLYCLSAEFPCWMCSFMFRWWFPHEPLRDRRWVQKVSLFPLFICSISWVGAFGAFKQRVENCVVGLDKAIPWLLPIQGPPYCRKQSHVWYDNSPTTDDCQCNSYIWGPGLTISSYLNTFATGPPNHWTGSGRIHNHCRIGNLHAVHWTSVCVCPFLRWMYL